MALTSQVSTAHGTRADGWPTRLIITSLSHTLLSIAPSTDINSIMSLPAYHETPVEDIDKVLSPERVITDHQAYDRLLATFASRKTQDLAYRLYNLKQLSFFITDNVERITAAIGQDLGKGAYDAEMSDVS